MENEYVVTFTISCPGKVVANNLADDLLNYLINYWPQTQTVYTVKPIAVYLKDEGEADNGNA
jgi:hypothetical protein